MTYYRFPDVLMTRTSRMIILTLDHIQKVIELFAWKKVVSKLTKYIISAVWWVPVSFWDFSTVDLVLC